MKTLAVVLAAATLAAGCTYIDPVIVADHNGYYHAPSVVRPGYGYPYPLPVHPSAGYSYVYPSMPPPTSPVYGHPYTTPGIYAAGVPTSATVVVVPQTTVSVDPYCPIVDGRQTTLILKKAQNGYMERVGCR